MEIKTARTSTLFLRYVIPQMIGLLFNSVYFIVDGIFIGQRLGAGALAAAGVAVPVVECMIALSMLISVGTGILISSAAGRGEAGEARRAFNLSVVATLALALLLAVAGVLFARPFSMALGANEAVLADTVTYLRTFMLFCPFQIFSFALSTYVRNDGRPGLAMWSLTIGSFSNILLDWVFMYPLDMGIGGAALATGLGPVFSVVLLLPHFLRRRGRLYFEKPRFSWSILRGIATGGAPAFVAEFSIGFVTLLYNLAIRKNGLGEQGLAAYVMIGYAVLICLSCFLGAAQGVQPVVSYCHGAGDLRRIRSLFGATAVFLLLLSGGLYLALRFGGQVFFGLFAAGNAALLADTISIAGVYFWNLPFAAVNILAISFTQSMGRHVPSLVLSLSRSTLPIGVCLWVMPLLWGTQGLWLACTGAEVFTFLLAVPVVLRALGRQGGAKRALPWRQPPFQGL